MYVLANSTSDFSHFVVNSTSGAISLIEPLDFEVVTSIELGVTAIDLAVENRLRTTSYLTVNVEVNFISLDQYGCLIIYTFYIRIKSS